MIDDVKEEVILKDLKTIFSMLKYTLISSEDDVVIFLLKKNMQTLKNLLNRDSLPMDLYYILLYRVVGDFLNGKLLTGSLEIETLDIDPMVSVLKRGDVSISFSGESQSDKFSNFIKFLTNYGQDEIYNFRVLRWGT